MSGKIVNQLELADLFGITRQTLRNWMVKGCPVHSDEGKGKPKLFNTAEVFEWREKFIRSSLSEDKIPERERAAIRRDNAKAETAEIELELLRKKAIPIDIVKEKLTKEYAEIRANFVAMPGEISADLELLEAPDIEEILSSKVSEILEALADDSW
ncbi:Phage DNA packaging protein Nu1 [Pseudovibrio sp. Ad13]|uniref:terminase small subunit n=1 Tax=Pseudovibrio sp. Ad13 TaxID=989396 RepID=UPI0007AE985C|nr:terminase small subunit [Pseudovibrio sp. Ad13]KZK83023.1 Phage DNA packaging protein Nu1 [Pseudovibrio sp. Ad13]